MPALSRASGLPEEDVETLLAGGTPPDVEPDVRVRQRVRFLYESHVNSDGQPKEIRDLADVIGQTTTWTRKLVAGEAKPNLMVGHLLTKYYNVAPTYLADPPDEALNRELQRPLRDLEIEVDPSQALKNLGVVHVAGRSADLTNPDLTALARMVASIAEDLAEVKFRLGGEGQEGSR
ncbi:hypothetical protein [Streptomyces similanensis]|uniref:hypothetical protein n=1 Tax=Streptomyces similanensis TaxID=1274988 RepID=UPI0031ED03EE